MSSDRREFLRRLGVIGAGTLLAPSLTALTKWNGVNSAMASTLKPRNNGGLGPLVQSTDCPELFIPEEFRCVAISRTHTPSLASPAFMVPNAVDGMGSFALPNGDIRLIRNHEMVNSPTRPEPLGPRPYDRLASGGTSSLTVRVVGKGAERQVRVLEEFISLGGTHNNCAGGITPWGSWLSCEENTGGATQGFEKPHGYVFEVPVSAKDAVDPVPLRAMGRMVHEAVAVDPRSGIVFETEDMRWSETNPQQPGAGFYRFIPRTQRRLAEGGRLQILVVRDRPKYNTVVDQVVGNKLPVHWVDIAQPDPAGAEADPSAVFREGLSNGAAIFDRLEGCFWADDSCYFISTSGGTARAGQVWRYVPEGAESGTLTLVFESPSRDVLDGADNVCVSSRGGIVICEDGGSEQFIRALSRSGQMVNVVMQPVIQGQASPREFAGSCFSPDGEVLFFNIQGGTTSYSTGPGATYALWGPWDRAAGV